MDNELKRLINRAEKLGGRIYPAKPHVRDHVIIERPGEFTLADRNDYVTGTLDILSITLDQWEADDREAAREFSRGRRS